MGVLNFLESFRPLYWLLLKHFIYVVDLAGNHLQKKLWIVSQEAYTLGPPSVFLGGISAHDVGWFAGEGTGEVILVTRPVELLLEVGGLGDFLPKDRLFRFHVLDDLLVVDFFASLLELPHGDLLQLRHHVVDPVRV